MALRCMRCGASAVSQSITDVLIRACPDLAERNALELSAQGALSQWLQRNTNSVVLTEYMPQYPHGAIVGGVRNEDVQDLSFGDRCFDLVTSTEVFEHVADDVSGFAEVYRVLRPGGMFIFTVPLLSGSRTHERATLYNGRIVHFDSPEYHADAYSGSTRVLCFRNYGHDIVERLSAAGFDEARIVTPALNLLGYSRKVLVAKRSA